MRRPVVVALLVAAVAAPGALAGGAKWPPATCRAQAAKVGHWGRGMLVHYDGGVTVYPADVSYLLLRGALQRYERHRCAPRFLGAALAREFRPVERRRLLSLLPKAIERSLRRALATRDL